MQSILIHVGSKNPVKIQAAKSAFECVFEGVDIKVVGIDAPSGVPDQPLTMAETQTGARNRVKYLQSQHRADFYIAYEGGVDVFSDGPKTFAVVFIADNQKESLGQTATLPIPSVIYQQLLKGQELGCAMDGLFNTVNIKQKGGAIGQLTNGLETRASIYTSATILTLAPFVFDELFT